MRYIQNVAIFSGVLALGLRISPRLQQRYFAKSNFIRKMSNYVDCHAHLIHDQFLGEEDAIAEKCREYGLEYVIVNGLEPVSNRRVLDLCDRHAHLLPAIGIYPLDAACRTISKDKNWQHDFEPPEIFDVDAEIQFIDRMASENKIVAIGECGLDKFYLTDLESMQEQERVLRSLMRVRRSCIGVVLFPFSVLTWTSDDVRLQRNMTSR